MDGFIYGLRLMGTEEIRYIGLTTQSISKRFSGHKKAANAGKKYPLYDWIRKHGIEHIEAVEIEQATIDLEQREIFWIEEYKRLGHRLLNLTGGGIGPNGHTWTEDQKKKQSILLKEIVNRPEIREKMLKNRKPKYGPKHSDKQKKIWSEQRKGSITGSKNPNYGKFGKDHPSYGRVLSEEAKQKLSEQRIGNKNPNFGKRASAETREKMSKAQKGISKPSSAISAHTRHHTNKGVVSEKCKFCKEIMNDNY